MARHPLDATYAGMTELLADGLGDIELVFAANDIMAVGAMSAIRDAGLTPGTDVAVAASTTCPR
jgi:LacI family transcriptional regulator